MYFQYIEWGQMLGRDLICSIRNLFDCEKWELDHSSKNV